MAEKQYFKNSIAENVFRFKYAQGPSDTWKNLAVRLVDDVCGTSGGTQTPVMSKDERDYLTKAITEQKFIPGGRYLYYAGRPFKAYNNCYLLKGESDCREEWGNLLKRASDCLMTGGGIGIDYSVFRPEGAALSRTGGKSSGPIPLMYSVNETGRNVRQGGSRRCLPEGALVHTRRGLVRIEDIVPGEDEALTYNGYRKVVNKFEQGEQQTVSIKTQTGEFICTPNHRMAVLTDVYGSYEWKRADELCENDRLIFVTEETQGTPQPLPSSSYERSDRAYTAKPVSIPELDEEMAWFLGYFQANGHSTIRHTTPTKRNSVVSISIPDTAPQLVDVAISQLARFGVTGRVKGGDGACVNVKVASVELALWMQEHIKASNEAMEVPDFIAQNTPAIRAAYIAGLMDGDGSNSSRPIQIMSCIHRGFLNQMQSLCASLGFATRVHCNRPAVGNWKALHRVLLKGTKQESRFYASVGKYLKYKIEEPRTRKYEQFSYSLPASLVQQTALPKHKKEYHQNYKVDCPIETWEKCTGASSNFTPIKVLEVEQADVLPTWDIEVEDRHEFYCNGYLTHNSAIYASINWKHEDAPAFLKSKNWFDMPIGGAKNEDGTAYTIWHAKQDDFNYHAPLDMTNISLNYDDAWLDKTDRHKDDTFLTNVRQAMQTGEPGFSFNFREKQYETLRNACTEVTSEDDSDVCNLGSINIGNIDSIEEFKDIVRVASKFLVCGTMRAHLPYQKVADVREKNRRLGLGLMGIHEWLLKKREKYEVTPELHQWLAVYRDESKAAADEHCQRFYLSQPAAYRAIAPTGTIGILAATTTGIEPLFAVAYKRRYLKDNNRWHYEYVVDTTADHLIKEYGLNPSDIDTAYKLAVDPERRMKFQADVQDYVDMSISSTINLPPWGSKLNNEDTVESFAATLSQYAPRMRGFTVYPDGSRGGQPLVEVDYETAIAHKGVVYEDNIDNACSGGVCGI